MVEFNEKAVIGRIIELRTRYAGNRGRSKFAAAIGISPSTYSYYENNRLPSIPILLKICEVTGSDIHWLLTGSAGEQNSFESYLSSSAVQKIAVLASSNPAALASLEAFIELLEEKTAVESSILPSSPKQKQNRTALIPVLGRTAAGMVGAWEKTCLESSANMETKLTQLVQKHLNMPIISSFRGQLAPDIYKNAIAKNLSSMPVSLIQKSGTDDEIVQFIDCPAVEKALPGCFVLQIDGDSMAPKINDGDFVLLSASAEAVQGQPAVVSIENTIGVTCKIIRISEEMVHLIPINEKYDTKIVPLKSVQWALAVLCRFKISP